MDQIQSRMGITPQHDILWGPLTCRDHLLFYGRLKGLPQNVLNLHVDQALRDVNLKHFENRRASALSGGMKRRLSVAMSLIGSPLVVYLDEPSTGLDPASKRSLWNVIAKAKGNKSIILTTHSMEEAEVLCDRIGVMSMGEVQCIGTASSLKHKYGIGYTFFISIRNQTDKGRIMVENLILQLFPKSGLRLINRNQTNGSYKYEILRDDVVLSIVFATMENKEKQNELELLDWSITETSLEEVFLKLAEMSHLNEVLSSPKENKNKSWIESCFCIRRRKNQEVTLSRIKLVM
jgi:ABC-type multidrug transport system ATPase subunit